MRFLALALDYDGTLATGGLVSPSTFDAIIRVRDTGRRLLLVTGRQIGDLERVFPGVTAFDLVVAENGAVLWDPRSRSITPLAAPPPRALLDALAERNVPVSTGHVICATEARYETQVREALRACGISSGISLNKGALMLLPPAVDKGSGLLAACAQLGLSPHNLVGLGDAENDIPMLARCEIAVAVEDAVPALRSAADLVIEGPAGAGVERFIDKHLVDDCRALAAHIPRLRLVVGSELRSDHRPLAVTLPAHHDRVLVVGQIASMRHAMLGTVVSAVASRGYQCLLIDTEGALADAAARSRLPLLRATREEPIALRLERLLTGSFGSVVLDASLLDASRRASVLAEAAQVVRALQPIRGAPHCIVLHDARRVVPAVGPRDVAWWLRSDATLVLCTAYPADLSASALAGIGHILATDDIAANAAIDAVRRARRSEGRLVPLRSGGSHCLAISIQRNGGFSVQRFAPAPSSFVPRDALLTTPGA